MNQIQYEIELIWIMLTIVWALAQERTAYSLLVSIYLVIKLYYSVPRKKILKQAYKKYQLMLEQGYEFHRWYPIEHLQ